MVPGAREHEVCFVSSRHGWRLSKPVSPETSPLGMRYIGPEAHTLQEGSCPLTRKARGSGPYRFNFRDLTQTPTCRLYTPEHLSMTLTEVLPAYIAQEPLLQAYTPQKAVPFILSTETWSMVNPSPGTGYSVPKVA